MHYKILVTVEIPHIDDWESYCEAVSVAAHTLLREYLRNTVCDFGNSIDKGADKDSQVLSN